MRPSAATVIAGILAGIAGVSLAIPITNYNQWYYRTREPFFGPPVIMRDGAVHIRNDQHGKGYFGALRNGGRLHKGIDLVTPVGQPIFASKSGRVVFSGEARGYGLCVDILHPDGLLTRYAHLSELDVFPGDWVTKEGILGKCGKTGNAAGPGITPHLHFEVRYKDTALNPTIHLLDPAVPVQ